MAARGKHRSLSVGNAQGEWKVIEGHWQGWKRVVAGGWGFNCTPLHMPLVLSQTNGLLQLLQRGMNCMHQCQRLAGNIE
jgi:hypothetical protein